MAWIQETSSLRTGDCTSCTAAQRRCLTSSPHRNTESSPRRSTSQRLWHPVHSADTWIFREEIGILTSLPLLRNVVGDLENARNNEECSLTLYFTKESHIHTLVNLVLQSGLPIVNRRIPELDYCVCVSPQSVSMAVSDRLG